MYLYLLSILNNKTELKMKPNGSCYQGDYNDEDHIHTVITPCDTEEP